MLSLTFDTTRLLIESSQQNPNGKQLVISVKCRRDVVMPTARVNGAEIYYEEAGSGPLLSSPLVAFREF
jgi:hypothetical protein